MQVFTNKFNRVTNKELKERGLKPQLGYVFNNGEKYAHDHRCVLCGKWFNYTDDQIPQFIAEGRWDFNKRRPLHCNSSSCQDYEEECRYWESIRRKQKEEKARELFFYLKSKGMVA